MNVIIKMIASFIITAVGLATISYAQKGENTVLNNRQKKIIPIAAFTATGNQQKLKKFLNEGLDAGLTINEIKEILVHIYAYAGFPRALNGIDTFMAVLDERKTQGIKDKTGKEASPVPAGMNKNAYGNRTRNMLAGRDISNRKSGYPVFTPVIDQFLVEHLFADIFYRDVLNHQERELVTISVLAAMVGTEAQLKAHLEIVKNTGFSEAQLKDYIIVLKDKVGSDSAERAVSVLGGIPGAALPESQNVVKVIKKTAPVNGSPDYFTGDVTVESGFASKEPDSYGGAIVNFKAGARTAWHTHPYGQTLIVISGSGMVQSEGDAAQEILPGDVVWIPANVPHWHGAAQNSSMSHVAISESRNGSSVKWRKHVSDKQYSR